MEKKWIWPVLFLVVAALGGYVWWSGRSAPSDTTAAPTETAPENGFEPSDAPILGKGAPPVQPNLPGARNEGYTPPPQQNFGAPPPGYSPTPQGDSFGHPPNEAFGNPNTGQFDNTPPPQAFENPDFITPPPPPTQFDTDPVPFDDEPPPNPPQNFDGNPGAPQGGVPEEFTNPQEGDY